MSTGRLRSPALRPHDVKAAETALYPPDRISSGRRRQGVGQLVHVDVLPGMMAEDFLCAGLELRLGRAHPEQQTAAVELRLQHTAVAVAEGLGVQPDAGPEIARAA